MKEFLSQHNVEHTLIDMTSSMSNLKAFLHYRDNYKEFDPIKEQGRVGLPCIVINDGEKFIFGQPELDELK
ncbi:MAG TPA: glutaredoxin [Bacillota bacterium]|nr:glutaredoxin [Bacillota bacterium]